MISVHRPPKFFGTFTGEMMLPEGRVIAPTGKAFDMEFGQTSKWKGDQLIIISAFGTPASYSLKCS